MVTSDGVDLTLGAEEMLEELSRTAIAVGQILLDVSAGSDDIGDDTRLELAFLGARLQTVAYEARNHERLMAAERERQRAGAAAAVPEG